MNELNTFFCSDCHQDKPIQTDGGTGYAELAEDSRLKRICYACVATRDKQSMIETGKALLYLSHHSNGKQHGNFPLDCQPPEPLWTVGNWPGTLKYSAYVTKGKHNIARSRYDVWFTGPDNKPWHGIQYGENTQITHCKRIKSK